MMQTTYEALQELAARFWTWRAENMPISYDDIPRLDRPKGWTPDWSPARITARREELADFESEWNAVESSQWTVPQQVDYRLIGSALHRVRWELDITRSQDVNPDFYIHQAVGALFLMLLSPEPFDQDRRHRDHHQTKDGP